MNRPESVRPGTAEQLARLSFFRRFEATQPEELDAVAHWILGAVDDKATLWAQIGPDCLHLWHLITDDWTVDDLDDMTEVEASLPVNHGIDVCYDRTREQIIGTIEAAVYRARWVTLLQRKQQALHDGDVVACLRRHPAGSRLGGYQPGGGAA